METKCEAPFSCSVNSRIFSLIKRHHMEREGRVFSVCVCVCVCSLLLTSSSPHHRHVLLINRWWNVLATEIRNHNTFKPHMWAHQQSWYQPVPVEMPSTLQVCYVRHWPCVITESDKKDGNSVQLKIPFILKLFFFTALSCDCAVLTLTFEKLIKERIRLTLAQSRRSQDGQQERHLNQFQHGATLSATGDFLLFFYTTDINSKKERKKELVDSPVSVSGVSDAADPPPVIWVAELELRRF